VLLADEPAGNLDTEMGNEVMDILVDLNRKEKTTVVMGVAAAGWLMALRSGWPTDIVAATRGCRSA
jgi:ABC-type ATPase involved in cell division